MHALAALLGTRALDLARASEPAHPLAEERLGPIASSPETAAAWRRWSQAAAVDDHRPAPRTAARANSRPAKADPA